MALVHEVICDQCGKREPAQQRNRLVSYGSTAWHGAPGPLNMLQGHPVSGNVTDYEYPSHWIRLNWKAVVCSWECAAEFSKKQAEVS